LRKNLTGGTKIDTGPTSFWCPRRIACLYSAYSIDKIATTMLRFRNRLLYWQLAYTSNFELDYRKT